MIFVFNICNTLLQYEDIALFVASFCLIARFIFFKIISKNYLCAQNCDDEFFFSLFPIPVNGKQIRFPRKYWFVLTFFAITTRLRKRKSHYVFKI
jgi:hypothetical protein